MKNMFNLLFAAFLLSILSCSCPECFNISEPVRIIYTDGDGNNLIENGSSTPMSASFCESSTNIPIEIMDDVVNGTPELFHLEFANEQLQSNCVDGDCCILIKFEDSEFDTLTYRIRKESDKCCTSYSVSKFMYNDIDLLGKKENTIGAYVVVKG